MAKQFLVLTAALGIVVCLAESAGVINNPPPRVTLRPRPFLPIVTESQTSPEEAEKIGQLIHGFANIDHLSQLGGPNFCGLSFAPISHTNQLSGLLETFGHDMPAKNVVALVKFGPKVIPFLLKALADQTPTKLTVTHTPPYYGGMWFANELPGNPANANEQNVIDSRLRLDTQTNLFQPKVGSYTLTVGDICFVILGQIVNRPYEACRAQMTSCEVLNSPTHDPILAKEVRELWSGPNPTQRLLDSLLTDFVTEKIEWPGEHVSPLRWIYPSVLKTGAAARLLFYFPRQSASLVADELRRLELENPTVSSRDIVTVADMVEAVSWNRERPIRDEIKKIFKQTTNSDDLFAAADAKGLYGTTALCKRVESLIAALPKSEAEFSVGSYTLLSRLAVKSGADAIPVFKRYLQKANTQRCETVCETLQFIHGNWTIEVLAPLLDDHRPVEGQRDAERAREKGSAIPYRVCDLAAEVIARQFLKTTFQWTGSYDDLDRQIKKMQAQIKQKDF